ncbi:MAG TPA: tRNA-modifying protein YgfZ, partial [Trueperaceae bacterium]|nr:tRNA-modifying protein YgfZ [Trueperaceae bacterium]
VTLVRAAVATVTVQGAGALATLSAVLPEAVLDEAPVADAPVKGVAFWRGVHASSGLGVVAYRRRRSAAGGYDLTLLGADRGAQGGSHQADAAQAAASDASAQGAAALEAAAKEAAVLEAAALEAGARSLVAELVAAGAVAVTAAAMDAARVVAGVTTAGRDGGAGVLPQEADLTAALSYRKGCYLGQEVMARIEARGNLKRGLATLELVERVGDDADGHTAPTVEPGAAAAGAGATDAAAAGAVSSRAIELNGRTVGVLGTTALMPDGRVLALAVVRRDLEEGTVVTAGGRELRILRSPVL